MFRATWNPNPNLHPHFIVGNMKRSSDVYSAVTGELIWNMRDEAISVIPGKRDLCYN
jgi:WD repeat-containing protein 76